MFLRLVPAAAVSALLLGLAACNSLPRLPGFGSGDPPAKAAETADRAGRITMVLEDARIAPSPELAGVEIALPEAATVAAWTEAGGGPLKVRGHVAAAEAFRIAWRRSVGEGSSNRAALTTAPVASPDAIFTIDARQTVRASRLSDGAEIWTVRLKGLGRRDRAAIGGGLAVSGNILVVSSGFGYVAALDAATGAEKWRSRLSAPMTGAPTIDDGRVFVASNNNEIFALDIDTGETLWSDQAIAESARVLGGSSAAAVEDFVIAPFSSGEIIAYLAANGRRLWTDALSAGGRFTPISEINDIGSRPVLGAGLVFASSQSGTTVAIDGRTGNRMWTQPVGSTRAPALVGSYLFVVGNDGELACLDAGSGRAYWVKQLRQFRNEKRKRDRIAYSAPIVASGRVVLASSEGELLAFSPQTGEQIASLRLGDTVYLEPIAAGGRLFVLSDKARLIAID